MSRQQGPKRSRGRCSRRLGTDTAKQVGYTSCWSGWCGCCRWSGCSRWSRRFRCEPAEEVVGRWCSCLGGVRRHSGSRSRSRISSSAGSGRRSSKETCGWCGRRTDQATYFSIIFPFADQNIAHGFAASFGAPNPANKPPEAGAAAAVDVELAGVVELHGLCDELRLTLERVRELTQVGRTIQ